MAAPLPTALSIAGSDPTGGAGLQLDLQVLRHHGVHGCGVLTALTIQDTGKVHRVLPVFPSVVTDQLRVLLQDWTPGAIKLGMLASDDVARAVARALDMPRPDGAAPVRVVDPVLQASDGTALLERRGWPALCDLVRGAALVTPNLFEAEALTGRDVSTHEATEAAARSLITDLGAEAVLVKGGHRDGAPDDLLAQREAGGGIRLDWHPGTRIEGDPVHGTGCALAAAATAHFARGEKLDVAVARARAFVAEGIRSAHAAGGGARLLGFA